MFHSPFSPIICISNAHSASFFTDDTNGPRGWKVVLCKELRGQRSHFTKKALELTLFDLGNNFDHACLKVTNHSQVVAKPPPNVNTVAGELITPTQVMVKEMAIAFEDDDDDVGDEQEPLSPKFDNEWLF
jgi:hypothetical protein